MTAQVEYFHEQTETPVEGKHFADWAFEEQEVFKIFQPSESQAGVKLSHYVESHRTQSLSCLAETLWCKSAWRMSVFTVDVLDTHEKWHDSCEGLKMIHSF